MSDWVFLFTMKISLMYYHIALVLNMQTNRGIAGAKKVWPICDRIPTWHLGVRTLANIFDCSGIQTNRNSWKNWNRNAGLEFCRECWALISDAYVCLCVLLHAPKWMTRKISRIIFYVNERLLNSIHVVDRKPKLAFSNRWAWSIHSINGT